MASEEQQPELVIEAELGLNTDWGLKLSQNLHVMAIREGGPFHGKCEIGDLIVQVNDTPVKTFDEFAAVAGQATSLRVEVSRGLKSSEVQLLPPDREKNVQRRNGYAYSLIQIDLQKGCKFGLGIKHHANQVLVSRVDEGSLSARSLLLGDRIIDINGVPVSDKDVAREMLLASFRKFRMVTVVIERPLSDQAKAATRQALIASEMQQPSVAMASDVREIAQRQKAKLEQKGPGSRKAGIIARGQPSRDRHVAIHEQTRELIIATDHEGKPLKHVGNQK